MFRVLKCAGDRQFRRLLSHFCRLKIYRAWVFQQFLCWCELSLSRFVDLYLLIDYFYYCNQIHHFLNISNSRWRHGGNSGLRLHNISDFTWFYYIDARSVPSGVFAHEGCAVVTFQKLGYPFTERKNKQGNRWKFYGFFQFFGNLVFG
jgi:hypothetical protein